MRARTALLTLIVAALALAATGPVTAVETDLRYPAKVTTMNGTELTHFHDVAVRNGVAHVVGYYDGSNSIFTEPTEPGRHGVLVGLDAANGQIRWGNRQLGAVTLGVGVDADGMVAVSGWFGGSASFDGTVLESVFGTDSYVARYNPPGT